MSDNDSANDASMSPSHALPERSGAEDTTFRRVPLLGEPPADACSNSISTAKYNVVTFVPKNLLEQFRRVANLYFLGISILMYIGTFYPSVFDSPLTPYSTLAPLLVVVSITMIKEGYEDWKRHASDREVNNRRAHRLCHDGRLDGTPPWKDLRVGDIVRVRGGESIPADLVLLSTSKPDGSCYIETSNIDGETDLKSREGPAALAAACHALRLPMSGSAAGGAIESKRDDGAIEDEEGEDEEEPPHPASAELRYLASLDATLECERPNSNLYKFEGLLRVKSENRPPRRSARGEHAVTADNVLLRGCTVRNTSWVFGVVTATGRQTKIMMKSGDNKAKMSEIEKIVNKSLQVIFGTQFLLCVVSVIAALLWDAANEEQIRVYLRSSAEESFVLPNWISDFFTFLVLFNNFIPISLYVTVEMVNYIQAMLVSTDGEMYDPETDTPARARTSNLNQDLGQIEYIFSDKTGTLTRNVMEFKACSIGSAVFGDCTPSVAGGPSNGTASSSVTSPSFVIDGADTDPSRDEVHLPSPPVGAPQQGAKRVGAATPQSSRWEPPPAIRTAAAADPWSGSAPAAAAGAEGARNLLQIPELSAQLQRRSRESPSEVSEIAHALLTVMSVCNTVVPEVVDVDAEGSVVAPQTPAPTPGVEGAPAADGSSSSTLNSPPRHRKKEIVYQAESPDEGALVSAARDLGYELVDRRHDFTAVQWHPRAGAPVQTGRQAGQRLVFSRLGLHPFDSSRKRMSVVVEDPRDNCTWLLVKGADNVMLERSNISHEERDIVNGNLNRFSSSGLRTLVAGRRKLNDQELRQWQEAYRAAVNTVGGKDAALAEVAERFERDLQIVGVTAIEDKLQEGVPDTISDLARAGIKTWVLTGDKVETAINIGRTCRLLTPSMGEPFRVTGETREEVLRELDRAMVALDELEWEETVGEATSINNINNNVLDVSDDDLRSEQASPAQHRHRARVKSWAQRKGDAHGFDAGQAVSPRRLDDDNRGSDADVAPACACRRGWEAAEFRNPVRLERALVISGAALLHIIRSGKDPVTKKRLKRDLVAEHALLRVALRCQAVIACRVSPKQKAEIVALVRHSCSPRPMTLAIGDGANDVSMIQRAQIGVGISGKEGMQAVNASDFAIAQFRFLKRLLLVHGRWSYRRMSRVLLYSFYKNVVLTTTLALYNMYVGFSGTSYYESMVYSTFNFVLGLPIVAVGVFDRDLSAATALRHPGVYMSGLRHMDLDVQRMGIWVFWAVTHGILLFFVPWAAMSRAGDPLWREDGVNGGVEVAGLTTFSCLVWAMQMKVALLTNTWTWVHWVVIALSQVGFYVFILVWAELESFTPRFFGVALETLDRPIYWFLIIFSMVALLVIDLSVETIRTMFLPNTIDVAIERDGGYIPQGQEHCPWGDESSDPVDVPLRAARENHVPGPATRCRSSGSGSRTSRVRGARQNSRSSSGNSRKSEVQLTDTQRVSGIPPGHAGYLPPQRNPLHASNVRSR